MDLELAGKVVLVTGGTRGIGRAIAGRLAVEGAAVVLCARDAGAVAATVAELSAQGARAHGIVADVTVDGTADLLVADSLTAFGRLDAIVANAGAAVGGPRSTESSADDWEATYRLNVVHPTSLVRAARPALAATAGNVVLIGSISAARPGPWPQYGAAKAALEAATRSLSVELAPDRVRVNCVRPGSIRFAGGAWERYAEAEPDAYAAFVAAELPLAALGRPEHVADVVAFVVSPRAAWVNGAVIAVDGAQQRSSPYPASSDH